MSRRDRSPVWVGIADFLLCVVGVVIIAVAPKVDAKGVETKAEYLLSSEWNVDVDADVDIWLVTPSKKPVFYSSRDVGCATLDRDNRGFSDSIITLVDGSTTKVDSDKETIAIRCIEPGHYDLSVHLYAYRDHGEKRPSEGLGVRVHTEILGLNPSTRTLFAKDVTLDRVSQTVNVTSFDMDRSGKVTLLDPPLESVTDTYQRTHTP